MKALFLAVFLLFSAGFVAPAQPKTDKAQPKKIVETPAVKKNCATDVPPQSQEGMTVKYLNQMQDTQDGIKYVITFVPPLVVLELDQECAEARMRILEPFKKVTKVDRFEIVTILGNIQYKLRDLREGFVTGLVIDTLTKAYGVKFSPYLTAEDLQPSQLIPLCPCQPLPAQPKPQNKNSL